MPYSEDFTIVNNSGYTLYLNTMESKKISSAWPTTISPRSTASFNQSESGDLNPTGVYDFENTSPPISAALHFYCIGVDPGVHVNMSMQFQGATIFPGSSISEDNSTNGHQPPNTLTAGSNTQKLNIDITNNGSSQGNAVFTIASN